MRGSRLLLALACVLAVLVAPAALAQGIGDVAARARESRERAGTKTETGPTFTNHDLDARRPPGSERDADDAADEAPPSSDSTSERREPERRYERRDADTARQTDAVNRAQAEVDSIERRIRELNGRLNPMSRDYVYGAATSGDPAGEELRIKQELSELEERLVRARQELAEANEGRNAVRQQREPPSSSSDVH